MNEGESTSPAEMFRCDGCKAQTELEKTFIQQRRSFSSKTQTLCPACAQCISVSRLQRWFIAKVTLALLSAALLCFWPQSKMAWLTLNFALILLFDDALALPHELGHAWAARALGWRVFKIIIGQGNRFSKLRLLGFEIELRTIPVGGLTITAPINKSWFRLKWFTFAAVGPAVNLSFGLLAYLLQPSEALWTSRPLQQGLQLGLTFLYANAAALIRNLLPDKQNSPHCCMATDGSVMLTALFAPQTVADKSLADRYTLEGVIAYERRQLKEAKSWFERGLELYPDNFPLRSSLVVVLTELKEFHASRKSEITLLARNDLSPPVRAQLLNNIAYVNALIGGAELLAEADHYSEEAMRKLGWVSSIKGTRGTVLLELGRIEEAIPLLQEALKHGEKNSGKAQNACLLAIAEARRGHAVESRKYFEEARQLDQQCFLLERAETALRDGLEQHY